MPGVLDDHGEPDDVARVHAVRVGVGGTAEIGAGDVAAHDAVGAVRDDRTGERARPPTAAAGPPENVVFGLVLPTTPFVTFSAGPLTWNWATSVDVRTVAVRRRVRRLELVDQQQAVAERLVLDRWR